MTPSRHRAPVPWAAALALAVTVFRAPAATPASADPPGVSTVSATTPAAATPPSAPAVPAIPPPPSAEMPAVAPDGRSIAYVSPRDSVDEICVVAVSGGGERRLTHGGGRLPHWSANGREVVYSRGGADSGAVFTVGAAGGASKVAARVAGGRNPVLSPDGRRVAYLVGPWRSTQLWVAAADGSGAHRVAGGAGTTAWNPAWAPDGARLAYTHGDSTRVLQIHLVDADGTHDRAVTHVTAEEGNAQLPAWSPDGRLLAVQVSHHKSRTSHLRVIDAETGAGGPVAPPVPGVRDEAPAWFPDGKRLAFQSNRSGTPQVWVMDLDGAHARRLTGG